MLAKLARILGGLLFCVLFLASCSSTSFVYNRLDFLLPWYINGYTDLDRDQEAFLDQRLQPFLDWHRARELPCYVVLLDDMESALQEPVSAADLAGITRNFELAWYRTQDEALEWLFELGAQLTVDQVEEFLAELDEEQEELEEKYLDRSDEEFHEEGYDNLRENVQDYLGRLQKEQRELMRTASEKLQRSDRHWLAERAAFIDELRLEMAREPGWEERVRALIHRQAENPAPEYAQVLEHNITVIQELVAQLLNDRTEKQDAHLRRKLAALRGDLQKLAAQAEEPASCPVQSGELQSAQL
ncbi:MAG: hypothetical protein Hals2KO_32680 [Halioglobus sp.]